MKRMLSVALLTAGLLTVQGQEPQLRIEQVMTQEELQRTGVATLSPLQREALNRWLLSYTLRIITASPSAKQQSTATTSPPRAAGSSCSPAIESTISGEFNGWEGETIFKLDNGQIWQQAEYDYTYSYSYRPDVTIYQTSSGCRLKVEDEEETIIVKRIK